MSGSSKPICIYANNEKNEFAIGFRENENFRAITKGGDFYTRFVDDVTFFNFITHLSFFTSFFAGSKKLKG